jgi:hypothetical protein
VQEAPGQDPQEQAFDVFGMVIRPFFLWVDALLLVNWDKFRIEGGVRY